MLLYGVLGLLVSIALLAVGHSTFDRIHQFSVALDSERAAVASSVSTVSSTLADTTSGTAGVRTSLESARDAADAASQLAAQTASTFQATAQGLNVEVFGVQPFAQVVPQFDTSATDLQQLSGILGNTRDALSANDQQVAQIGTDLSQLQQQLNAMSTTLNDATAFGDIGQTLVPFEVAFYGVCLLLILQSLFGIALGLALLGPTRGGWRSYLPAPAELGEPVAAPPAPDAVARVPGEPDHAGRAG